jgi:iron complex transport system substrate-binding protein
VNKLFSILFVVVLIPQLLAAPQRIISLSPHLTEILFALGAGERVVAVTNFCQYPAEAQQKQKIGGFIDINLEQIIALKPDLILGVPAHDKLRDQLRSFGIEVHTYPNETVRDIFATIESVGTDIGASEQGRAFVKVLEDSLNSIVQKGQNNKSVAAMLVIGREPGSTRNITVAGPNTFISEIWLMAGGINIFSDLPVRYGTVNLEELLVRNPAAIIEFDVKSDTASVIHSGKSEWAGLEVAAVVNGNTFTVAGTHTLIPGPRMLLLARQFAQVIRAVTN